MGIKSFPGLVIQHCRPVCSSRILPPVSANQGRNLRSVCTAPFMLAQHGPRLLPSLSQRREGAEERMPTRRCCYRVRAQPESWLSWRINLQLVLEVPHSKELVIKAAIIFDSERPQHVTLRCLPCVNILPGTVEWSHVMQVKYTVSFKPW